MRHFRNIAVLLLIGVSLLSLHSIAGRAWAQIQAATENGISGLRIISPKSGETISQRFVRVQYAPLQQTSASAKLTFELRLDNGGPVQTADTGYTFTGLTPGAHDVVITVVGMDGIPLRGSRSEVHFAVMPQGVAGSTDLGNADQTAGAVGQPANQNEATPVNSESMRLPEGQSSLPLLSIIGFGILLGGVISALRTRPAR